MSWPQWSAGGNTQPTLPSLLNPATPLINPAPPIAAPGLQYSQDQWSQMQQQNWQQWAQWQQQYQQWHQQYGAEYQKSLSAINTSVVPPQPVQPVLQQHPMSGLPNVGVPPPLPVESNKPPLPLDPPPPSTTSSSSTIMQSASNYTALPIAATTNSNKIVTNNNYSTAPPPPKQNHIKNNPRLNNNNWSNNNTTTTTIGFSSNNEPINNNNKRMFEQNPDNIINDPSKRLALDPMGSSSNLWQQQQRPPPSVYNQASSSTTTTTTLPPKDTLEQLSEAERKFDKQFADWEAQFNKWKEQNVEHPDKDQYRQYEKKWETWRAQLLERREQMKRKRLNLTATLNLNINNKTRTTNTNFTQPPPLMSDKVTSALTLKGNNDIFNKPPPNLNDEPLSFKQTDQQQYNTPNYNNNAVEDDTDTGDFFKLSSSGGIPGLDLIRDEPLNQGDNDADKALELKEEKEKSGPDFDAISKGINTILGDKKLLSMLSMVSQNQMIKPVDNLIDSVSRINKDQQQQVNDANQNEQSSNLSHEDKSNTASDYYNNHHQREFVTNFDDQTRSSFTMTHNDSETTGGRFGGDGNATNFGATRNQNQKFDQFGSFDRGGGDGGGGGVIPYGNNDNFNKKNIFGGRNSGGNFNRYNDNNNMHNPPPKNNNNNNNNNNRQFVGGQRGDNDNFNYRDQNQFNRNNNHQNEGNNRDYREGIINNNRNNNFDNDNFNRHRDGGDFNNDKFNRGNFNNDQFNRDDFISDKFNRVGDDYNNDQFNRNDFITDDNNFNRNNSFDNQDNFNYNNSNEGRSNFNYNNNDNNCNDDFENDHEFNDDGINEVEKLNNELNKSNSNSEVAPALKLSSSNDDDLLKPATVIDYDHKSMKSVEAEVLVEPIHMFDYRHKPLNRIPFPQRPKWLSEEVRHIREFDPPIVRTYELTNFRRYPPTNMIDPYERWPPIVHNRRVYNEPPLLLSSSSSSRQLYDDRRPLLYGGDKKKFIDDSSAIDNNNSMKKRDEDYERTTQSDILNNSSLLSRRRPAASYNTNESRISNSSNKSYNIDIEQHHKSHAKEPRKSGYDEDYDRRLEFDRRSNSRSSKNMPTSSSQLQNNLMPKFELIKDDELTDKLTSPIKKIPEVTRNVTLIEDLISPPGRYKRPPRIVIILRGPPGSGKTFLAKLIKDKEVENGGSPPRILSLDDYFMVEQEKEITEDGKRVKIKEMIYEYEANMEEHYRTSLTRSFRKTVTDGYFPFIIVDNVNDKVKYFGEMWSFAKQNGFQVYICQLELDVQSCTKRNIHGRTESEIEKCVAAWELTPSHHPVVDATSLTRSGSIPDVEMEEINSPSSDNCDDNDDDVVNDGDGNDDIDGDETTEDQVVRSKWDNFDCSVGNLAKLDGVSKPFRNSRTMEEYLQMDSDWTPSATSNKPGQKRVRWADLEEQREQQKMRALGFVVGQTNWKRMMDPSMGSSALTQTKYFRKSAGYF